MGSNDINHTSYRNNDGYINPNFKAGEVKTETISPQTKVIYSTKPDEFVKENKTIADSKEISTGAKVALYGIGLAVIGFGIWKGKGIIAARKAAKKAAEKTARKTAEAAKEIQETTNIAQKFKIKKYVTPDNITEINALTYKDGKLYTGKVIDENRKIVYRYKDGKMVSQHQLWDMPYIAKVERNGKYFYYKYSFDKNGKIKIEVRKTKSALNNTVKAKSIGQLPSHSYTEIPDVGVVTRGVTNDYSFHKASQAATNPNKLITKINYNEITDMDKVILAVGKTADGKKVVFLKSPADRFDRANRPISNLITLTSKGEEFSPAQLDLIIAISGKSNEKLLEEMPLARAISSNSSRLHETINIDINTLLNEIAHFSKGRQISSETQTLISKLNTMPNNSYIRIV